MTKNDITNGISWIKQNLALVVAFFALVSSAAGWYASYSVLAERVAAGAIAIQEIQKEEITTAKDLHAHYENTSVHVNPVTQKEIADRLTRIENLLIEHMNKRGPLDK